MLRIFCLALCVATLAAFQFPTNVPDNLPPCFSKAQENKCNPKEKVECNGPLGSCVCDDGSKCIWTNMQPVAGCPCKTKNEYEYPFIEQAKKHGCND